MMGELASPGIKMETIKQDPPEANEPRSPQPGDLSPEFDAIPLLNKSPSTDLLSNIFDLESNGDNEIEIDLTQAEEEDQLEEVGRKPRPSINALRRRRKSSRIECFQMIEEKKFTNDMS